MTITPEAITRDLSRAVANIAKDPYHLTAIVTGAATNPLTLQAVCRLAHPSLAIRRQISHSFITEKA